MSEIQLQSQIVRNFSERFPAKRGQLFHVANERNNKIQAFQARAIGIFPGVSDFIYFEFLDNIKEMRVVGIEVKEPGSTHKTDHVRQQVEWAEILIAQGGEWVLVRDVFGVLDFIVNGNVSNNSLSVKQVKEMLDNCKTKTIKF